MEAIKGEMDEKGTSMTDAGPLVKIKQSLTRLKTESRQMEVHMGVVSGAGWECVDFNRDHNDRLQMSRSVVLCRLNTHYWKPSSRIRVP